MAKAKPKIKTDKHIADVMAYQVNIAFDPRDKIYVARVPELEHCHSHGDTAEDALANAKEAIELWLATAKAEGIAIPEPISRRKFSGKFVLRTSPMLHAKLAQEAAQRDKSLNEMAVELIENGLKGTG